MKNWENQPAIVIASGPSLHPEDIDLIRQSGMHSMAVNSTYFSVDDFCEALFAGDTRWWRHNEKSIRGHPERWSHARAAVTLYDCHFRPRKTKNGFNSGCSAIEVVANVKKANPVLMIGFDCSVRYGVHHHPDHKKTSNPTAKRAQDWKPQFKQLLKICRGTRIINCSRYTEIDSIEQKPLRDTLCELGLISALPSPSDDVLSPLA